MVGWTDWGQPVRAHNLSKATLIQANLAGADLRATNHNMAILDYVYGADFTNLTAMFTLSPIF